MEAHELILTQYGIPAAEVQLVLLRDLLFLEGKLVIRVYLEDVVEQREVGPGVIERGVEVKVAVKDY